MTSLSRGVCYIPVHDNRCTTISETSFNFPTGITSSAPATTATIACAATTPTAIDKSWRLLYCLPS